MCTQKASMRKVKKRYAILPPGMRVVWGNAPSAELNGSLDTTLNQLQCKDLTPMKCNGFCGRERQSASPKKVNCSWLD